MNYVRQTFAERREAPEKRFHLSLKKKSRFSPESKENDVNLANKISEVSNYRTADSFPGENSPTDSQNYVLRLSDDFSISGGEKKLPCYRRSNEFGKIQARNNTTVSISDSNTSSGDNSPLGNSSRKKKGSRIRQTPFYPEHSVPTIVIESSESEEESLFKTNKQSEGLISLDSNDSVLNTLNIDKEDPFDRLKRSCDRPGSMYNSSLNSGQSSEQKNIGIKKKSSKVGVLGGRSCSSASSSTHYSPDSDLPNSGAFLSRRNVVISESSSNDERISSKTKKNQLKSHAERSRLNSSTRSKRNTSSSGESFSTKANNIGNVSCKSITGKGQSSAKPYDSVKLTKKDAERIFKGGNSHWTPKFTLPLSNQLSESLSGRSQGLKSAKIINETPSELAMSETSSGDEIISNSTPDFKPTKTHISRFFNPPNQEQQYGDLSDRKKTEISHWLMNNTPGSSSSSSIVSESNRNSSFGNSSLERFELKHETPNNRGKLSKPNTLEKAQSVPKGIEKYIYRGKSSVLKNQSPLGVGGLEERRNEVTPNNTKPKSPPKNNLPTVKDVQNLHIEDCAQILDKLYGNVWRNKADAVLTPQTEPKIQKNLINKGQSKTERKPPAKPVGRSKDVISSSEEDEFDIFAKDIRPNFNSTKKKLSRDSFLDDKSPSENSSESFYHTALTHPRESKGDLRPPKQLPVSLSTKRAVAICDSDSDLDVNYPPISDKDLNKKRLSFSEDESDTSTSEFDPGEVVLPKPKAKKAPIKTVRKTAKATKEQESVKQSSSEKRPKSFLASLSPTVPIHICHPEARVYRDSYKTKKEELCRYLFTMYNKEVFDRKLPDDMAIEWNVRMRGTAGFCYNRKSVKALGGIVRSSRIVLATKILDTPDRLRDTLIHEMCHAAAWLINNVSDGHGPFWKGWASKAVKVFPELPPIKRCHDYKIKTKFTYRCTKCGYSIGRHSKSLNIESKRCGHCYGKFELLVNRTTRSGTTQVSTPVQARTATGFALFVKENYHSVKKDRRSIKHAEVMRILGQQFSAVKIGKQALNSENART